MTENTDSLYPEVSQHGSLAAALNAETGGIHDVCFADPGPGRLFARAEAGVSTVTVLGAADVRQFVLRFGRRDKGLANGVTEDLTDVRGVAESWLGGASLKELACRWAFVEYTEIQEAYERGGTVDVIEAYWRTLLREVSSSLRPVVEEARERPRMRAMFPVDSHHRFRVVTDLGKRWTTPYVRLKRPKGFELVSAGEKDEVLAEGDARTVIDAYVRALGDR